MYPPKFKKIDSDKFRIVNKDGSIESEHDTEEVATLECWSVLGQKVIEAATGQVVYPKA